jgi:hypothetical protein
VKNTIRYIRFRSTEDGGRVFDFSISGPSVSGVSISVEVPAAFFAGDARIALQQGASVCYAKLRDLVQVTPLGDLPSEVHLSKSDLDRYRESVPARTGARP